MSVFRKIRNAVGNITAYPDIAPKSPPSEYIVYNFSLISGEAFGDDLATEEVSGVQVHYFVPIGTNYLATMEKLKQNFINEGFTHPRIYPYVEEDINKIHIVFDMEIEMEA